MYTLRAERVVQAPPDVVWDIISDIEAYGDYAPNLSNATKTSTGQTPSRRCTDTQGRSWDEACVRWEEGTLYSYVVDTSDYPYPFVQLKGTWGLQAVSGGTKVTMRFDYTPRGNALVAWIINRVMVRRFTPVIEELLNAWETEMLRQAKYSAA